MIEIIEKTKLEWYIARWQGDLDGSVTFFFNAQQKFGVYDRDPYSRKTRETIEFIREHAELGLESMNHFMFEELVELMANHKRLLETFEVEELFERAKNDPQQRFDI